MLKKKKSHRSLKSSLFQEFTLQLLVKYSALMLTLFMSLVSITVRTWLSFTYLLANKHDKLKKTSDIRRMDENYQNCLFYSLFLLLLQSWFSSDLLPVEKLKRACGRISAMEEREINVRAETSACFKLLRDTKREWRSFLWHQGTQSMLEEL